MKHIEGRWFLYTPIIIFLLYLGLTSIINEYNSLTDEEVKETFFVILIVVLFVWMVICGTLCNSRDYTPLWYSPLMPLVLLIHVLIFLDKFFQKHFTVNFKK